MISRELLEAAEDRGIIQQAQIEPLLNFLLEQSSRDNQEPEPFQREEPLRFVRGVGDIFISFGVVILIIAIEMLPISGYLYFVPVAGFVVMAEWLVRVRRLSLPGVVILLAVLYFINQAIGFDHENATIADLGILSFSSLIFYLRYKMPFSLFPLASGVVAIAILEIGSYLIEWPIIFSALGLIIFFIAMSFDIRDTRRDTYLSDSAFWLHLLAAPLMVHGLMISVLFGQQEWMADVSRVAFIVAFFFLVLLIALLLDRRAMLVSTQLYMVYAVTKLLQNQLNSTQNITIYVLLILGSLIIFFGTYWYKMRRLLYGFLSNSPISRYVPDLNRA